MTVYASQQGTVPVVPPPVEPPREWPPIDAPPIGDEDDTSDPGSGGTWEDIGAALDYLGRIDMAVGISPKEIMVAGGRYTADLEPCAETLIGTLQTDGTVEWEAGGALSTGRSDLEVVYIGGNKWMALGGWGYYDEDGVYHSVTMMGDLTDIDSDADQNGIAELYESGKWSEHPIVRPDGGYTQRRSAFPRDSMKAAYIAIDAKFPAGIWLFSGRNTSDQLGGWERPGSMFNDLWWAANGTGTWELVTPISDDTEVEFEDNCGFGYVDYDEGGDGGYRVYTQAVLFNGTIVALGGIQNGYNWKDVYSFSKTAYRFLKRVTQDNDNPYGIMTGWPEDVSSTHWICGAAVWKNRIVAMVVDYTDTEPEPFFFESTDIDNWVLSHKGDVLTIESVEAGKYVIDGDQSETVEALDRIVVLGTDSVERYTVSNVAVVNGKTKISLSGVTGLPTPDAGSIYVNRFKGVLDFGTSEWEGLPVKLTALGDYLYIIGGQSGGKLRIWRAGKES
jgi:hypothetical protein